MAAWIGGLLFWVFAPLFEIMFWRVWDWWGASIPGCCPFSIAMFWFVQHCLGLVGGVSKPNFLGWIGPYQTTMHLPPIKYSVCKVVV